MNYFGQRDPRWSGVHLGKSKRTVYTDGCTTSTIADASSYFGFERNPGQLAGGLLSYTLEGYILWESIPLALNFKLFKRSRFYDKPAILDGLKDPNKTVSLNVDGGRHWVFALSALPFNKFWVHDPWTNSKKVYGGVVGSAIMIKK